MLKRKFRDVVDFIEYDDLIKIKKDIESGGIHIKNLVEEKIKESQKSHDLVCSFCNSEIDSNSTTTYTLIFGPNDFRKKATFCAIDCLESFLGGIKEMKERRLKGQNN